MQFVVEIVLVGDVADTQGVVLVTAEVGRPGDQAMIGADLEGADIEELVTFGFGVLIEHEIVGRRVRRAASAVDRVRLPLLGACRVVPIVDRDRRSDVGLLDPGLDLVEQLVDELGVFAEPRPGDRVLGLEVGDRVRIVAIAQPRERVVERTGRPVPGVRDLLGDGL